MKRIFALLMAFTFLFFCGCDNNVSETSDSEETTDRLASSQNTWSPNLEADWEFEPALPSDDYINMFTYTDVSTYDIDFHLDIEEFSLSDIPEEIYVTIENRNGTPFMLKAIPMLLLEKKFTLPKEERDNYSMMFIFSDVWVRTPLPNANSSVMWSELTRHEMNHTIDITKFENSLFSFTPGEYRLVLHTLAGAHYAYFTITE